MKAYQVKNQMVRDKAQERRTKRIQKLTKRLINEGMTEELQLELDNVIKEIREVNGIDIEEAV